jgi:putative DNA primase/helicase
VTEEWDSDAPPPTDDDINGVGGWQSLLKRTQKGDVVSCGQNAMLIVRHHEALVGRLGTDERAGRMWWYQAPPWGDAPRYVNDTDGDEMSLWLAGESDTYIGQLHLWRAICAECARNKRDDVRDWLDSLVWDEKARVDDWLVKFAHATDSSYSRAVGAAWLVSAVARTYDPGCQADYVLVLEGPQGAKKTSLFRALGGDWMSEISISESKDAVMAIHGPWICEWGEMSGMSRSEVEYVKGYITRKVDRVRPPYGRVHVDMPRRCVFGATTNAVAWLTDPTGGRRFWPVRVGGNGVDIMGVNVVREQLWAEAVYMYRHGARWYLGREHEELATAEQADRYSGDAWEEQISTALYDGSLCQRNFVTLSDIVGALALPPQSQTTMTGARVAQIMQRLGWPRGREKIGSRRSRGYKRPEPVDNVDPVSGNNVGYEDWFGGEDE